MTLRNRDDSIRDPDDGVEQFDLVEAADDAEADPKFIDEVFGPVEINPVYLARGRGNKGGNTKALAVRLPSEIRREMKARVQAGEFGFEGELVRFALIEYFANRGRSGTWPGGFTDEFRLRRLDQSLFRGTSAPRKLGFNHLRQ